MRKATSMKELNERRQQAEELQKLREENSALRKDIDGMVRTHKDQTARIKQLEQSIADKAGLLSDYAAQNSRLGMQRNQLQNELAALKKSKPDIAAVREQRWMEVQEKLKVMDARITWYVERINKLEAAVEVMDDRVDELEQWRKS